MKRRHVVDKRSVKLESVAREDYIPFMGGKPDRNTVIDTEDVTNLIISLNTSKSLEEFVETV
jgi:hypothetical protein